MNILILHRIPYSKKEYHRGIDHAQHAVTYIGTRENIDNIPEELNCEKVILLGERDIEEEVADYLYGSGKQFDHIISLSEYELLAAAKLREQFNVNGSRVEQVLKVRDKIIMKQAVHATGIKVPNFINLNDFVTAGKDFMAAGAVVVKPIDGASSENVLVFANIAQALKSIRKRRTGVKELDQMPFDQQPFHTPLARYEMEEYIEGSILHIDGLVQEGQLLIAVASCYVGTCLDYARGQPLGSVQIDMTNRILAFTAGCIRATEIKSGSFHLEAILHNDELYFLEIANRSGGADVVKTFELATGIHLPSAELKLILQQSFDISHSQQSSKKFGWFVYPGHHIQSRYAQVSGSENFKSRTYIYEWSELSATTACKQHITYQSHEAPIAGIVSANSSDELISFLHNMFKTIKVSDNPIMQDGAA